MTDEIIEILRRTIDNIDDNILFMLEERIKIANKIIKLKKSRDLPAYDPKREEEIIKRILSHRSIVEESVVKEIWNTIFEQSKNKK